MQAPRVIFPVLLLLFPLIASAQQSEESKQAAATKPVADNAIKSQVVYISDFELDVVNAKGKDEKIATPGAPTPAGSPAFAKQGETPAEQASKFVDLMSTTLVKEFEKAGYTARRLQPGEARPDGGIGIRGVFAEPDEQNRLRRAVIGNATVGIGDKMALFVGVSNLARPEQALYAVADPKGEEKKAGPVITVSAYAPVAKFDIDRNASEKSVREMALAIATNVTVLLNANVAALTH